MATAGPDTATAPYTKRAPNMLMIVISALGAIFRKPKTGLFISRDGRWFAMGHV